MNVFVWVIACFYWCVLWASSEKKLKGVNDCLANLTKTKEVRVSYSVPYQERLFRFCWNIPPRCSYTVTKRRILQRLEKRNVTEKGMACCDGYKRKGSHTYYLYPKCVPDCQNQCSLFGSCIAPEVCLCASGQKRNFCSIDDAAYHKSILESYQARKFPSRYQTNPLRPKRQSQPYSKKEYTDTTQLDVAYSDNIVWEAVNEETKEVVEDQLSTLDDGLFTDPMVVTLEDIYQETSFSEILDGDQNNTKAQMEKKEKMVKEFKTAIVLTVVGILGLLSVTVFGLFYLLKKKTHCWKFKQTSQKPSENVHQNPTMELEKRNEGNERSSSCLSLHPCNLEDEFMAGAPDSSTTRDAAVIGRQLTQLPHPDQSSQESSPK